MITSYAIIVAVMLKPEMKQRYLARFDELITEGELICGCVETYETKRRYGKGIDASGYHAGYNEVVTQHETLKDMRRYDEWKTNCLALLHNIAPTSGPLAERINFINMAEANRRHIETCISTLKALKESFKEGFMDDLFCPK